MRRRKVTKQIVAILAESEKLKGDARTAFVRERFEELELAMKQ